jgi:hypothetical protein
MKKFIILFAAILAYLVFSSRSCEGPEPEDARTREAELAITKERVKNEFASEELSRQSLRAFEEKAVQKLADLADYLNLYTDKSMDSSFREQARRMILGLFISDSVQINPLLTSEKTEKYRALAGFLATKPDTTYRSVSLAFGSVEIAESLHRTGEGYYGTLTFSRQVTVCTVSDTTTTGKYPLEIEMVVLKSSKAFGPDTLQVWGVFLGNVK